MLKIVKSKKRLYIGDVREQNQNCKVLVSDLNTTNMEHVTGCVYAISTTPESFVELCKLKGKLLDSNNCAMIVGSYGGGDIGVQCRGK